MSSASRPAVEKEPRRAVDPASRRAAATRERLFAAAEQCFLEQTYDEVSVRTINADFVSKVAEGDATATVRCETCHRGRAHPPKPLADLLADTAATQGADAAVAKYTEMRSESLESGQYDFRARSVVNAARRLQDEKHAEAATSLLKGAVALFPNSADVAATLGMALLQGGDRDGAKAQFDRALAIDPNNGQAQQGLRRLQGGQGGRP